MCNKILRKILIASAASTAGFFIFLLALGTTSLPFKLVSMGLTHFGIDHKGLNGRLLEGFSFEHLEYKIHNTSYKISDFAIQYDTPLQNPKRPFVVKEFRIGSIESYRSRRLIKKDIFLSDFICKELQKFNTGKLRFKPVVIEKAEIGIISFNFCFNCKQYEIGNIQIKNLLAGKEALELEQFSLVAPELSMQVEKLSNNQWQLLFYNLAEETLAEHLASCLNMEKLAKKHPVMVAIRDKKLYFSSEEP